MEPIITCDNLVKIYRIADLEVMALQGLDLKIYPQEVMAIIGASGSGKSTLLNILGGLDEPTAGSAVVAGWNLGRLTRSQRLVYMREIVGFVWQNVARNLVPYLTAEENVLVPMILNGKTCWADMAALRFSSWISR
jgi:ABC-type lipoprotein export system ATPase subunit